MQHSARENYLATEVMTATPQKLQLMLIEAAIRSAQMARQKWHDEKDDEACESLIHAQQVVGEMLASLNREVAPELVEKVAAVYIFVFRSLMEANQQRSEEKLDDALRVLEIERETWRQVCEKLGSKKKPEERPAAAEHIPDLTPNSDATVESSGTGFSLEA